MSSSEDYYGHGKRRRGKSGLIIVIIALVIVVILAALFLSGAFGNPSPTATVPGAPLSLVVDAGDGQASLSWAAPASNGGTPIQHYVVFRNSVDVAHPTTTAFVDVSLVNGQTYSYQIAAVNTAGRGPSGNTVNGVVPHVTAPPASSVIVSFIDVGQGDSILIETPDSKHILIDAGPQSAASVVTSFLQSHSVTILDALIITHPDADHLGGADEVLASVSVLSVYHPGLSRDTQAYSAFISAANAEGCPIYTDAELSPGSTLPLSSSVSFTVLAIDAFASESNDASIVLKMTFGTVDFIFEGDASSSVESKILSNPPSSLDVEILKVSHHGSSSATSVAWLNALTPSVAVIEVGAGNSYGHPTSQTLNRLASAGAQVYRTDTSGTVIVTTNGSTWTVT